MDYDTRGHPFRTCFRTNRWQYLIMNHPQSNSERIRQKVEEKTIDPRDLVNKGGFNKNPREMVENPAVTPEMHEEVQENQAGFRESEVDENSPNSE